jgi:hypothetical protein
MRKTAFATFASFGLVTAAIVAVVGSVDVGQAQSSIDRQQSKSMATALAEEFRRTRSSPDARITFESAATYDGYFVEMKYVMTDSALFSRLKRVDANQLRRVRARDYCTDARIAYLRQGIVVHEVFATSDHSDRVDVSIGSSSCGDVRYGLERLGCMATPRPHFANCAPDDRPCEVASKMRGCMRDDMLRKPTGFDR